MPDDDDEIARNTRRRPFVDGRSTKRGFGGEGGPRIGSAPMRPATARRRATTSRRRARRKKHDKDAAPATSDKDDDKPQQARKKPSSATTTTRTTPSAAKGKKDDAKGDEGDDAKDEADDSGGDDDDAQGGRRGRRGHVAQDDPDLQRARQGQRPSFTARPNDRAVRRRGEGQVDVRRERRGRRRLRADLASSTSRRRPVAAGRAAGRSTSAPRIGVTLSQPGACAPAGGTAPVPDNYNVGSSSRSRCRSAARALPVREVHSGSAASSPTTIERTLFGGRQRTWRTTTGFVVPQLQRCAARPATTCTNRAA